MALYFELKLTGVEMAILFATAEFNEAGVPNSHKEPLHPVNRVFSSHFVGHAKALLREGLLEPDKEGRASTWTLTRKGWLTVEILREEFDELRKSYPLLTTGVRNKRIKAAA